MSIGDLLYKINIKNLSPEDIKPILKEVSGQGGFQDLIRKLQSQYSSEDHSIFLESEDINKMIRYLHKYGQGGFQDRIKKLIEIIKRINDNLNDLLKSYNK